MTLTEFCLARIAEREVTYRLHPGVNLYMDATVPEGHTGVEVHEKFKQPWTRYVLPNDEVREKYMIAIPANEATLRECAALRTIVNEWIIQSELLDESGRPAHLFNPLLSMLVKSHLRPLQHLGTIWSTHPDYDESWRP